MTALSTATASRIAALESLAELNAACRGGDGVAWIGLFRPDAAGFGAVAARFDLHALAVVAVVDAGKAHQRPKLERYGEMLFLVLRPARYLDQTETSSSVRCKCCRTAIRDHRAPQ